MTLATRRALCAVMVFAVVEKAGTVVMKDEEELDSWSVILNGHVQVNRPSGDIEHLHMGDRSVQTGLQLNQLLVMCCEIYSAIAVHVLQKCAFAFVFLLGAVTSSALASRQRWRSSITKASCAPPSTTVSSSASPRTTTTRSCTRYVITSQ